MGIVNRRGTLRVHFYNSGRYIDLKQVYTLQCRVKYLRSRLNGSNFIRNIYMLILKITTRKKYFRLKLKLSRNI